MKAITSFILGFLILASFSSYALADEDWQTCGGDGKTETKNVQMPKILVTDTILKQ